MSSITRVFLSAVVVAVCVLAPMARAQIDPLPDPTKTVYPQPEIEQINAFMTKRVGSIGGADAQARERARSEIQAPLRRAGVSVAFRRAVREATLDQLTELAGNGDDEVVINALYVLAEIGDDASRGVVQQHTDHDSLAVRYAAVGAMKRTFRVVQGFQPAIAAGRVGEMVAHLQGRLRDEEDDIVADAIVQALLVAARIDRDGFESVADRALIAVASGVGERLRSADAGARPFALMSSQRVGEVLVATLRSPETPAPEVTRAAAGFGGEALATLGYQAREGQIGEERASEVRLSQLAERTIELCRVKLGGAADQRNLSGLLESGQDQDYFNQVSRYVLGLSGDPIRLPASDMGRINDALAGE